MRVRACAHTLHSSAGAPARCQALCWELEVTQTAGGAQKSRPGKQVRSSDSGSHSCGHHGITAGRHGDTRWMWPQTLRRGQGLQRVTREAVVCFYGVREREGCCGREGRVNRVTAIHTYRGASDVGTCVHGPGGAS